MTESSRLRMTGTERREQLIAIGRGIIAAKGFDATTVEEVAEKAGVSKPVVYEHFGGKEGLYAVVVDREIQNLLGRITRALSADNPRAKLEQAAEAFLSFVEEEPEGFTILVRGSSSPTTAGTFASLLGDIAEHVQYILQDEFGARGFDKKLAPLYARALVGMVAQVGLWWLDAGKPRRGRVAAHLVNLAWNGLANLDRKPGLSPAAKARTQ